jgi:AraC-like DNA-binding protein
MPALGPTPFRHALPVPNRLFDEPLYITHAGWERISPGEAYPLAENELYSFQYDAGRSLPEFTLCLITEGTGEVTTDADTKHRLTPGDAFFLIPGQWHRHHPLPDTGWTMYWIYFSGHLPHAWLKEGAYRLEGVKPLIQDPALYRAQFERLLLTAHRSTATNSRELSWQAIGLISHFLTDPNSESAKTLPLHDEVSKLAIEHIWNHTHGEVDIAKLAHRLEISRRTLERCFRQATGRSLLEEIQNCRVERARRLLLETDIPIKEIVFRAGFNTREQLRLAFTKAFGQSPNEFRHQNAPPDGREGKGR